MRVLKFFLKKDKLSRTMAKAPVKKTIAKKRPIVPAEPPPIVAEITELAGNWRKRLGIWKKPSKRAPVAVGSDCSGYGSDLLALRLLGLQQRMKLLMVCEASPAKMSLHAAMSEACGFDTSHCRFYDDIFERNNMTAPRLDFYSAGYPCPSFSRMGARRGTNDRRGLVTLQGLHYIATARPRALVLEQVSAITDKTHKHVWDFVQKILRMLDYEFVFEVLNTKNYGVPQSRPRLYLMAVCRESVQHGLVMPPAREDQPDLHTFLDKSVTGNEQLMLPHYEAKIGPKLWTHGFIVDVDASVRFQHALNNCSPCLTKTRCKGHGYYIPKLARRLRPEEMARLQGFPSAVADTLMKVRDVPHRAFEEGLGDGMSVNVLQTVVRRCLDAAGLTAHGEGRDWWLRCPRNSCFQLADNLWTKYDNPKAGH